MFQHFRGHMPGDTANRLIACLGLGEFGNGLMPGFVKTKNWQSGSIPEGAPWRDRTGGIELKIFARQEKAVVWFSSVDALGSLPKF